MESSSPRIFGIKSSYRDNLFLYSYFDENIKMDRNDTIGSSTILHLETAERDASSTTREEFI